MRCALRIGVFALGTTLAAAPAARAQVFVRAPFVRVQVGPGVAVRAPFFRLFVPPAGPVVAPAPVFVGPAGVILPPPSPYIPPSPTPVPRVDLLPPQPPSAAAPPVPPPAPTATPAADTLPTPKVYDAKVLDDPAPPAPTPAGQALTLEQFAKTFQAKAGAYEIELLNPVTRRPARVRFTLPDGTPKRVEVRPRELEFRYGPFNFVRIEFDNDGAQVITRLR